MLDASSIILYAHRYGPDALELSVTPSHWNIEYRCVAQLHAMSASECSHVPT